VGDGCASGAAGATAAAPTPLLSWRRAIAAPDAGAGSVVGVRDGVGAGGLGEGVGTAVAGASVLDGTAVGGASVLDGTAVGGTGVLDGRTA